MGKVFITGVAPAMTAPSLNKPIRNKLVGESVFMNVGGKRLEFLIVQQGKPNSPLYDESCDGAWCLLKDCYEQRKWNNTDVNDYENSTINAYLNGEWFNLLDANIRNRVKQVRIPYRPGAGDNREPINSGVNGLLARVFLLSSYEIGYTGGATRNICPEDGTRLNYFNDGSGVDPKRMARFNGVEQRWFIRSPACLEDTGVKLLVGVYKEGQWTRTTPTSFEDYIRPCIILKSSTLVDPDGNVIG